MLVSGNSQKIFGLILSVLIFSVCVVIYPLYSANQNLYFLKGLAVNQTNFLKDDWLVNTVDPFPWFTVIVELTDKYPGSLFFYLYFLVFSGIYFYSLMGMGKAFLSKDHPKTKYLLLFSLVVFFHSKAIEYVLSQLAPGLGQIFHFGFSQFYILGNYFQPNIFSVFLVFSIWLFLKRKYLFAVVFASIVGSLHPGFLMDSIILNLTYLFLLYRSGIKIKRILPFFLIWILITIPGVFYFIANFYPVKEVQLEASNILVNYRDPHHNIQNYWKSWPFVVQIGILIVGFYLMKRSILSKVLTPLLVTSLLLTLFYLLTNSPIIKVLFPWRTSALLIPISLVRIISTLISKSFNRFRLLSLYQKELSWIIYIFILLQVLLGISLEVYKFKYESFPEEYVYKFIKENKIPGDVYLIPVKEQKFEFDDFRLFTGASAFVDFKAHPYKDIELIEWYRRVRISNDFYKNPTCENLKIILENDKLSQIVLYENQSLECKNLNKVYEDSSYKLYKLM